MELAVSKLKILAVIIIVVGLAIGGYFAINHYGLLQKHSTPPAETQQAPPINATAPAKVKLSDTKYWPYSYLISTDTIGSKTQAALAGFKLERTVLADGTQNITLKALQPEYKDQSYTVLPGQKLYFIETSFGDDHANIEGSLSDDVAVLVDADGYVIKNK